MKQVLIVGAGSYIGTSFARYAADRFCIHTVDAMGDWQATDFSAFDAILHVAGIAHIKQNLAQRELYFDVNCKLAVEVARRAADAGAQFVFLSSMSVYGVNSGVITADTIPGATDLYGGSKLAAEQEILALEGLNSCILRPPMVYGHGCRGNFPKLVGLAKIAPIFPRVKNERSMIYIDNLCEFICLAVEQNKSGVYFPQNAEYVNTTCMVENIARAIGRKLHTTRLLAPLAAIKLGPMQKMFGSLVYEKTGNEDEYNVVGFEESVRLSVTAVK